MGTNGNGNYNHGYMHHAGQYHSVSGSGFFSHRPGRGHGIRDVHGHPGMHGLSPMQHSTGPSFDFGPTPAVSLYVTFHSVAPGVEVTEDLLFSIFARYTNPVSVHMKSVTIDPHGLMHGYGSVCTPYSILTLKFNHIPSQKRNHTHTHTHTLTLTQR